MGHNCKYFLILGTSRASISQPFDAGGSNPEMISRFIGREETILKWVSEILIFVYGFVCFVTVFGTL